MEIELFNFKFVNELELTVNVHRKKFYNKWNLMFSISAIYWNYTEKIYQFIIVN